MSGDPNTHNPSGPPPRGGGASDDKPLAQHIDVLERGADKDGEPQTMDRRLFMQLLVFRSPVGPDPARYLGALADALEQGGVPGVVYADVNDPHGLALLSWSEDPAHFVDAIRPLFHTEPLTDLELRPEMTMIGRTYSSGFEQDLQFWIIDRPRNNVLEDKWPWAVWYPLRRSGAFERLPAKEQSSILRQHAVIGKTYGQKDLAHDVRLACHGLDPNDNDFVIGLVGENLHRLSHVVQTMRKTRQTSEYIERMGPFFVGRAVRRVRG